jgi:hypothetical protein
MECLEGEHARADQLAREKEAEAVEARREAAAWKAKLDDARTALRGDSSSTQGPRG